MYFILRFIVIKVEILQNKMSTKTLKLLNFVETIKKMGDKEKELHAKFLFCFVPIFTWHLFIFWTSEVTLMLIMIYS